LDKGLLMKERHKNKKVTVAVGMSGGVDSSVAAALLQDYGYKVLGLTMAIFDPSVGLKQSRRHACYGPEEKEDVDAAASVCKKLGIAFHVIDLRKEYRIHVIDYFRSDYLAGNTPNPCVVCNHRVKFGFLQEKAREAGITFDLFATGHYARIEKSGTCFLLKRAADLSKDQTYFLYALSPAQLSHTLFPLGDYTKQQVRAIARSLGLTSADRPESQDFIAGGDYSPLFNKEEVREGDIVDEKGRVLGRHKGIIYYTVGQRRGLGIASSQPLYVKNIDAEHNRIVVGQRAHLFSEGLIARDLNLIALNRIDQPYRVTAKIRQKHKEADATIFPHDEGKVRLLFDEPQMAVTPGQSAVFYSGDTVLGGGVIETAL
jgi:tRNA-specific 2-thiouridylase